MPDLSEITAAIATLLRGNATAGAVHDRLRSVDPSDPRDYERLAAMVRHDVDGWRGFFLDAWLAGERRGTTHQGKALAMGEAEISIGVSISWILRYDDAKGSTTAHRQMGWDAAETLRAAPSLGFGTAVARHGGFQGRRPRDRVRLSEAMGSGHYGEADLTVYVITTAGLC